MHIFPPPDFSKYDWIGPKKTDFFLNMTASALNITGCVQNMIGFFINVTGFVLNMIKSFFNMKQENSWEEKINKQPKKL